MNASQKKIVQMEFTIHALEELLTVSEFSFLEECKKFEEVNKELKKSIQQHVKLENDIEQILDSSSDAIRVIDKDYNIVYTSKSFNLLHGHPKNIIGKKCHDVVPEKECFTKDCSLDRIIKSKKKFSIEKTLAALDGTKKIYNIDVIPYNDSNGEFLGVIKNYRDITEERQAEKRLAAEIKKREMLSEKYRILFETSGDAIMLNDEKGFFDCNKATLELFGYSKKEFLKLGPVDITTITQSDGQDTLNTADEHTKRALREGTDCFEWNGLRKDGSTFPSEVMLSRMEYQGKTVLLAVVRNIAERRKAEERLAEEVREHDELSKKYRILFESSGDAIMLFNKKGFFDCNNATLKLFGLHSKKQFIKMQPSELSAEKQPDGQDSFLAANAHIDKAYREGTDFFEWEHKHMDGTPFLAEVLLSRMDYQDGIVVQATVRDISERKQAEEKISHISAIQNLILENSTLGISLVRNRMFEWVNPRVGELLMLPIEQIQGASTRVIYPSEESYQELGRIAYPALVNGGRSDNTLQLKRSDGSLFWCRFVGKALDSKNIHDGSIWTFEDITDKKKAQEIAEENAQQHGRIEMANNMLHDIGNAMTGISSYVLKPQMEKVWQEIQSLYQLHNLFMGSENELIKVFGKEKQHALNDFVKALISSFEGRQAKHLEFSEKISSAVGHVCSVLDLQRHYLRENTSPLETKISLPTIISDTLVMLSESIKKRDIKVSLDVKGENLNISGDQTRLMRVFLNIIKNACEAFDEVNSIKDGRMLEITVNLYKDKEGVKVIFLDNGIGFTAEYGEKLFERGFTSKINGSGIGLHECRSIIESHGGTISMTSKGINTGALTIITFPILK